MAGAAPASAAGTAARRLRREFENLRRSQVPQIAVQPSEDNLLEWHFVLHSFDADTPYQNGRFHGKILFPPEYPLAPPSVLMLTPSGRLETGKRLCLSMTDFHPESWNPAWSVETILVGLLSFFVSDKETGYGAVVASDARRRQYAAESHVVNLNNAEYRALFPEFAPECSAEDAAEPARASAEDVAAVAGSGVGDAAGSVGAVAPEGTQAQDIEAGEGAVVGVAAEQGSSSDEEPTECWICRDTTAEPLIQPCACRGSMSGVHASCVEDWIRHHRRNQLNDEAPRCSVCHHYYRGQERQPGVSDFVRLKCYQGGKLLFRTLVLVFLVCGYQAAATGKGLRPPVRIVLIAVFAAAALHKLAVLTVSLPLHRPPPRSPAVQHFFVGDLARLSRHLAEASATVLILGSGCLTGTMPWPFFAPVGVAALVPVTKVCFQHAPSHSCFRQWLQVLCFVLCAPFVCVGYPVFWSLRHPRAALKRLWHSVSPLGPGPQVYISVAAIVLCLACESNVAPVLLWAVHSGFLLTGLVELFLVQRLPWERTRGCAMVWVLSLQVAALATYLANALCVFPRGWGAPNEALLVVHAASCSWFLLVSALTIKVNWAFIVGHYRVWQRRHGHFTLQVPASSDGRAPLRAVAAADAPPV